MRNRDKVADGEAEECGLNYNLLEKSLIWVSLGEQSIKDADVLSEKINFSAPGGSTIHHF